MGNGKFEKLMDGLKPEIVTGDGFIAIRDAAKLSKIHPVALDMGRKLLDGKGAAKFNLATKELQEAADDIRKLLLAGLRRVAAYLGDGDLSPKSVRQGNTLAFYFDKKGSRKSATRRVASA